MYNVCTIVQLYMYNVCRFLHSKAFFTPVKARTHTYTTPHPYEFLTPAVLSSIDIHWPWNLDLFCYRTFVVHMLCVASAASALLWLISLKKQKLNKSLGLIKYAKEGCIFVLVPVWEWEWGMTLQCWAEFHDLVPCSQAARPPWTLSCLEFRTELINTSRA